MGNSNTNSLHFDVESLESRKMLAANIVNMSTNGAGDVVLSGNGEDNHVEVSLELINGEFRGVIRGHDGTQIRYLGQAASEQAFDVQFTEGDPVAEARTTMGDLRISLGGGDDTLEINPWVGAVGVGLNVGGDLRVDLGAGNDVFDYTGVGGDYLPGDVFAPHTFVAGDSLVRGQAGDDLIEITNVSLGANATINEGASATPFPGDSGGFVMLNDVAAGNLELRGGAKDQHFLIDGLMAFDLEMSGGNGSDLLRVRRGTIFGDVLMDAGSTTSHTDHIRFSGIVYGDLDMRGAGGSQRVSTYAASIQGKTEIRLGGGEDLVFLAGGIPFPLNFGDDIAIRTGAGDDVVAINGQTSLAGNLRIEAGGGNDVMRVDYDETSLGLPPMVLGSIQVFGGGGFDIVSNFHRIISAGEKIYTSIEDFNPS